MRDVFDTEKDADLGSFLSGMDVAAVPDDLQVDNWYSPWKELASAGVDNTSITPEQALNGAAALIREIYPTEPSMLQLADGLEGFEREQTSSLWPQGLRTAWEKALAKASRLESK